MAKVFVEQPLASTGSAKYVRGPTLGLHTRASQQCPQYRVLTEKIYSQWSWGYIFQYTPRQTNQQLDFQSCSGKQFFDFLLQKKNQIKIKFWNPTPLSKKLRKRKKSVQVLLLAQVKRFSVSRICNFLVNLLFDYFFC